MVNKELKVFNCDFFKKNRRGWIKIIEAFFAIMLIMSALLVVINKNYKIIESSSEVYIKESEILKEIELNESLRANILDSTPPVEWEDFESAGLSELKNVIENRTPNYLDCGAKICDISDECQITQNASTSVYVNSVRIFANLEKYSPKKLKMFCWEK